MSKLLLASLLLALVDPPAHAADQAVLGAQFQVPDPRPGTDPSRRKLATTALERASDDTVVGNPLNGGATLTVFTQGASSANQSFVLPAAGWGIVNGGFRYRRPSGNTGAITSVRL